MRFPYRPGMSGDERLSRGRIRAQVVRRATDHPGDSAPSLGAASHERESPVLMSRMDRVRATARLLPTVPVIGVVVVLNAFGLAPAAVDRASAT